MPNALASDLSNVIRTGNIEEMKQLIASGIDVNQDFWFGSLLHYAAYSKQTEIVNVLILANADLDKLDDSGNSAFYYAIDQHNIELVSKFVDADIDVNSTYGIFGGMSPLSIAAMRKDTKLAYFLVENGAKVNTVEEGHQPLHWAADAGDIEMVKFFIESGAELNVIGLDGRTPLHSSISNTSILRKEEDQLKVVKYLLENGARIDIVDGHGYTPFHLALLYGKKLIVEEMVRSIKPIELTKMTPVEMGILLDTINNEDSLGAILQENKEFVNQEQYFLPITIASWFDNTQAVKALIEAGANVNRVDQFGNRAIYYACINNNAEIIKSLLDAGANIHLSLSNGKTLLDVALSNHADNAIRELAKAGANINQTNNGRTLMEQALITKQSPVAVIEALIEAGANLLVTDSYERNLLHLAIKYNLRDPAIICYVVNLLVVSGIPVNAQDVSGETALHYVATNGNACIANMLLKVGADSSIMNKEGMTAFDIALYNGNVDVAFILLDAL